jgi:poly-gamma-glutamate capsule biosynthesis protein CapA/YwtB (metallophosphatase superfamily)
MRIAGALALTLALALAGLTPPAAQAATGTVHLMAAGDVMLGRTIGQMILSRGASWPFQNVAGTVAGADLFFVNLECAITNRGTAEDKHFTFRAPRPAAADSLLWAGVDFASQANNHSLDYGVVGLEDTMSALDRRAISHAGAGNNAYQARGASAFAVNGLRIAVLAYVRPMAESSSDFNTLDWEAKATAPGVAIARATDVAQDVAAAKVHADVVVVFFHFGREMSTTPSNNQAALAKAAIGAGASLVLGAHPHVLQGYVAGNHTLIAYSLGNFVFDKFTGVANDSAILDVTLSAAGVERFSWIPLVVTSSGRPRLAVGDEIPRVLARIPNLSP